MAQPTNRLENLRSLRTANLDAAFATAFVTMVSGTFLVGFIQFLGGGQKNLDLWIGIATGIPSFIGLLQIPGAIWGRSFKSYKKFVLPGGLIWRLCYVPFLILPFLGSGPAVLTLLIALIAIGYAAVQLVNPIYNDWLAEMVPENSRGWFFSRRNAIAVAAGAISGLLGGLIIDAFNRAGNQKFGYLTIFSFGIVCSALSFTFFLRMHDQERANPVKVSIREGVQALKGPLVDRNFRRLLFFFVIFIAGQSFPGNLFGAFALESLKMDFTIIQLAGFCQATSNVLSVRMWGYLSDKYGNKPIIAICGAGIFLTPVMWIFCQPGKPAMNAAILMFGHSLGGVMWAGVGVTQFTLLLATAKPEDRANYIGVGLALQSIVGAVAPVLGAIMMAELRPHMAADHAYKWVFGATMLLRLLGIIVLAPVKEKGAVSIRGTLRHISKLSPKSYRALRQLTHDPDVATRESAMASVASQNFALAGDELIKALHDPSPRLRRQAATALAKLHDPRAVEALIHQIEDHPDLLEEETVEALGDLRDPVAVPALTKALESPRSLVRRAAAKALGRIGSSEAEGPLIETARQTADPDLRRAALQALRLLGTQAASEVVSDALMDPHPSVRIAAAEAVSELNLVDAAPRLRESLKRYEDEAESEVAYALGCVGSESDIPTILAEAQSCISIITRRRCLLGVARMLQVETESYRLMMLDGMSRDAALLERLGQAMKGSKRLRSAVELYSGGKEREALDILAKSRTLPVLQLLADNPVEELFIIAACAAAIPHQK